MPSRRKKQSTTIVVRPMIPGTRQVTKTVLGKLDELNHHAPLVSPPLTHGPRLSCRPLPETHEQDDLPPLGLRSASGRDLTVLPRLDLGGARPGGF
ncbi:hypothetical protein GY45DRAFT_1321164 [Cubamyces sp. BRFM 1775]|nr:hypothetical protein GY45DRAFT_1321164 [Cubamyces sp. BRFM 1775]